jgi:hypothetical protein
MKREFTESIHKALKKQNLAGGLDKKGSKIKAKHPAELMENRFK